MRIKRYLAHDMQEALIRIKADLGKDAVILSTKKVRQKGLLGFFKKPLIEVTAACEDDKIVKKDEESIRQESLALSLQMTQIKELEKKIDSLEKALKEVIKKEQEESQHTKEASRKNFLDVMRENLIKNGVENEIVDILLSNVSGDGSINTIVNSMYREIKNMLGSAAPLSFDSKFPKIVFFVGPTGVGKTTTIAKIAAKLMFEDGKRVGFITADTYRIAAVEQLKTYAEIMNIKTKVWYEVDEYDGIIESLADSDVVLVDTAGRSHKNQEHMDELKAYVAKANPDEVFLLLSATTQPSVFKEVVNTYSFLDNYKVIVTKVDEVSAYGNILNIRYFTNLDEEKLMRLIECAQLINSSFDIVLIDTGAGISRNVMEFVMISDEVIVITTPEPTSITDAYAIIKAIITRNFDHKINLLINKVNGTKEAEEIFFRLNGVIKRFLQREVEYIGYIEENSIVSKSVIKQVPFMISYEKSSISRQVENVAKKLVMSSEIVGEKNRGGFSRLIDSIIKKLREQ